MLIMKEETTVECNSGTKAAIIQGWRHHSSWHGIQDAGFEIECDRGRINGAKKSRTKEVKYNTTEF